jgi:hypothetical protein
LSLSPIIYGVLWEVGTRIFKFYAEKAEKLVEIPCFTYLTQITHTSAHLHPLNGIFIYKPLILVEIYNFQFTEILIFPRNVAGLEL